MDRFTNAKPYYLIDSSGRQIQIGTSMLKANVPPHRILIAMDLGYKHIDCWAQDLSRLGAEGPASLFV